MNNTWETFVKSLGPGKHRMASGYTIEVSESGDKATIIWDLQNQKQNQSPKKKAVKRPNLIALPKPKPKIKPKPKS